MRACGLQRGGHLGLEMHVSRRLQIQSLVEIKWHLAVFDEAHKLKNDGSATYQTASMLHKVTKRLYGLSGTVMQVSSHPAIMRNFML